MYVCIYIIFWNNHNKQNFNLNSFSYQIRPLWNLPKTSLEFNLPKIQVSDWVHLCTDLMETC